MTQRPERGKRPSHPRTQNRASRSPKLTKREALSSFCMAVGGVLMVSSTYQFPGSLLCSIGALILLFDLLGRWSIKGCQRRVGMVLAGCLALWFAVGNGPVEWTISLHEKYAHEWGFPRQGWSLDLTRSKAMENPFRTESPFRFTPAIKHGRFRTVLKDTTLLFEIPDGITVKFEPRLKIWANQGPNTDSTATVYTAEIPHNIMRNGRSVDESAMLTIESKGAYVIRYRVYGILAKTNEAYETEWKEFTIHIF